MTVSAPQRVAQTIFSTSSETEEATAELPILALIFTRKLRPMIIGSISGWLMLAGMIARPRAISSRTNSGVTWSGIGCAERLPVTRRFQRRFAAQVLANRDVFHLRRDDAAPGIGQLGDGGASLRPDGTAARCREFFEVGRLAAPQAVVFRLDLAAVISLHIAARFDPTRPQRGQSAPDVDRNRRIAVGTGTVVDPDGSFTAAGLKIDLAQGNAQVGVQAARHMDLARRGQGSGRNREYRIVVLGHFDLPYQFYRSEIRNAAMDVMRPGADDNCRTLLPFLRRHDPDQVQRVSALRVAGGISAPYRGSPGNAAIVQALDRLVKTGEMTGVAGRLPPAAPVSRSCQPEEFRLPGVSGNIFYYFF